MPDRRISALAHRTPLQARDGALSLAERPQVAMLSLRVDVKAANRALRKTKGFALPETPNTSRHSEGVHILWLGPDEWLFLGEVDAVHALRDRLTGALVRIHHQLLDVGDQNAAIALSGKRAREVLMKLTTLDLHPREFQPGDVAGSLFGRATATLHLLETSDPERDPEFLLIVRRSYADYLWCVLARAGREFGLPDQTPKAGEIMRP